MSSQMDLNYSVFHNLRVCDMAKDYAKRVFTTSARKPKKKRLRKELLVIPILVIAGVVGFGIFKERNVLFFAHNSLLANAKTLVAHQATSPKSTVAKPKMAAQSHQEPTVHFDFYNELPNMQVTVHESSENTAPKAVPKTLNKTNNKTSLAYVLQFGIFHDEVSAGQLRLSLLLSGIDADVVAISAQSGGTYRVQSGPFLDQMEVKKRQRQFQDQGITTVVKKA